MGTTRAAAHSISPRVFISSTVQDLQDLRTALAWTLRQQGFVVFQSECSDFPVVGDRSAFEECFANICQSDYYVLMIGRMRGTLYDAKVSITRQEYRVARKSFVETGRPRLHLYLRKDAESALNSNDTAAIEYKDHLSSFIDEVQSPDAPNFLQRFADFPELMDSLSKRLSLGRDFSERILRHSLLSELSRNLSLMCSRDVGRRMAFPQHWYMANLRQEIALTPDAIGRTIPLARQQIPSLMGALCSRLEARNLATEAIKEALAQGIFLRFEPARGTLTESPEHVMLRQTNEDIGRLCQLERNTLSTEESWERKLLTIVAAAWNQGRSAQIPAADLALALAYYDRLENIFNGHVSLCRLLMGRSTNVVPFPRRPETPLGTEMERRISDERVQSCLVRSAIQNDLYPFGTRISSGSLGATRSEQMDFLMCAIKAIPELGVMDEALLKEAAESFLDNGVEPYDEPNDGMESGHSPES